MLPLIPLFCAVLAIAGVGGLAWYENLSKANKDHADRLAAEYAWKLYQKSVSNLTQQQADVVANAVRRYLGC